jgi:hypothetical protein
MMTKIVRVVYRKEVRPEADIAFDTKVFILATERNQTSCVAFKMCNSFSVFEDVDVTKEIARGSRDGSQEADGAGGRRIAILGIVVDRNLLPQHTNVGYQCIQLVAIRYVPGLWMLSHNARNLGYLVFIPPCDPAGKPSPGLEKIWISHEDIDSVVCEVAVDEGVSPHSLSLPKCSIRPRVLQ